MDFRSELVGSFSTGSNDNPTVEIIEAAFRHHKMNYRYINCEVLPKDLKAAVDGARAMDWVGFNCSIPHKVEVIKHLDGLGESASVIGAVNCAVLRDGKFIGENTDGKGFLASLQTAIDPKDKEVVIFGAGGAARAVAVEVALAGACCITIVNRDDKRGQELTALLNEKTKTKAEFVQWSQTYQIPATTHVVVNATSMGMHPNVTQKLDFNVDTLLSHMVVADVVVNPPQTVLIKDATAKGCKVLNGFGMIVNQGVLSVKYWTGKDVSPDVMRERLLELL
jgi:shikimate dehydrogenase